jgi:hypothetical protein
MLSLTFEGPGINDAGIQKIIPICGWGKAFSLDIRFYPLDEYNLLLIRPEEVKGYCGTQRNNSQAQPKDLRPAGSQHAPAGARQREGSRGPSRLSNPGAPTTCLFRPPRNTRPYHHDTRRPRDCEDAGRIPRRTGKLHLDLLGNIHVLWEQNGSIAPWNVPLAHW